MGFEFVSQESFPEEIYTKELVYLSVNGIRVGYVRRKTSSGGSFWSEISTGISVGGKKKYYPAFAFDSNFLNEDIKKYLDSRGWETKSSKPTLRSESQMPF